MRRLLVALLLLPAVTFAAPVPKVKETKLLACAGGVVTMMNPDGTNAEVVHKPSEKEYVYKALLAPNGGRFVLWYLPKGKDRETSLTLRTIGKNDETELAKLYELRTLFWSADGKSLFGTSLDQKAHQTPGNSKEEHRSWRMDATTGERTDLDIPKECQLFAQVPGSGKLACLRETNKKPGHEASLHPEFETYTTDPAKYDPTVVISEETDFRPIGIFPDGKKWFGELADDRKGKFGVYTVGDKEPKLWEEKRLGFRVALSPDGTKLTCVRWRVDKNQRTTGTELWVANVDGKDAKKVAEFDKEISHVDWR